MQMYHLWKMYHLEERISVAKEAIASERGLSVEFTKDLEILESNLKNARKAYAKCSKSVLLFERRLNDKKKEKVDLVRYGRFLIR